MPLSFRARFALRLITTIALVSTGATQTPQSVIVARVVEYTQTAPDAHEAAAAYFGVGVSFATTVSTTTQVTVTLPDGRALNVPRDEDNDYFLEQNSTPPESIWQVFPPGDYRISTSSGGGNSTQTLSLSGNQAPLGLPRAINFEALQYWLDDSLTIELAPIAGATPTDFLQFILRDDAGQEIIRSPDFGEVQAVNPTLTLLRYPVTAVPDGDYTVEITVLRSTLTAANNNATALVALAGLSVNVPVRLRRVSPPVFIRDLEPMTIEAGATFSLEVETKGAQTTYQWFENGGLIRFGPENRVDSLSRGGIYHVVARNRHGATVGKAVTVRVLGGFGMTPYLGDAGEAIVRDGPAAIARFKDATALAADHAGNLYVMDAGTLRRISPNGEVVTIAGQVDQYEVRDGFGSAARFTYGNIARNTLTCAADGSVILTDTVAHVIRRITPDGNVTTIAGLAGTAGDADGDGAAARFEYPTNPVYDVRANHVLVTDSSRRGLRAVSLDGRVSTFTATAGFKFVFSQFPEKVIGHYRSELFEISVGGTVTSLGRVTHVPRALTQIVSVPGGGVYALSIQGMRRLDLPTLTYELMNPRHPSGLSALAVVDVNGRVFILNSLGRRLDRLILSPHERARDPRDHAPGAGHFDNLSTRARIEPASTVIAGFVLPAPNSRSTVLRGVGPALAQFNVQAPLPDPELILTRGNQELDRRTNWHGDDGRSRGAFPLPSGGKDSVITRAFDAGPHTVQLRSAAGQTGTGLVELYLDPATPPALAPLNLSTRARVTPDDPLIVGFSIGGDRPLPVLVRAIGPGLAKFDVPQPAKDPNITVYRGDQPIAFNEDWDDLAELVYNLAPVFASAGAFALEPNSADAALVTELEPGAYTAVVRVPPGDGGDALVEVYTMP